MHSENPAGQETDAANEFESKHSAQKQERVINIKGKKPSSLRQIVWIITVKIMQSAESIGELSFSDNVKIERKCFEGLLSECGDVEAAGSVTYLHWQHYGVWGTQSLRHVAAIPVIWVKSLLWICTTCESVMSFWLEQIPRCGFQTALYVSRTLLCSHICTHLAFTAMYIFTFSLSGKGFNSKQFTSEAGPNASI